MSLFRLFLALVFGNLAQAEVVTLITGNRSQASSQPVLSAKTITLAEGDVATALYVSNAAFVDITIGNVLVRIDANDPDQRNLPVVTGPATLRLANFTTLNAALATFSIKRANTDPTPSSQVVVIPDDGRGSREIALESSTDMVNWTPTQAGIFDAINASRFFHVRVTKVPEE